MTPADGYAQGRSFSKQVDGAEPVKTTRSTIKFLEFPDLSSDLTHFLAQVVEALTQVVGAQAPTTKYETTPWLCVLFVMMHWC